MSLMDRATGALFGPRVSLPPDLPAELLPEGVTLRAGRLVPKIGGIFGRMRGAAAAVTLGRTIVLNPDARLTRELLVHELTHVRQWREDALFPLRYTLATLKHGYWNNPYEVEARVAAAEQQPEREGTPT